MRLFTPLLISCLLAGCTAVSPMPGHLTQNVNQAQMTTMLNQNLKPGMPMAEAEAFLKKEEFSIGLMKEHMTGHEAVKFIRKDPIDFWTDQSWTVTLEGSHGKLVSFKVTNDTEKPAK